MMQERGQNKQRVKDDENRKEKMFYLHEIYDCVKYCM